MIQSNHFFFIFDLIEFYESHSFRLIHFFWYYASIFRFDCFFFLIDIFFDKIVIFFAVIVEFFLFCDCLDRFIVFFDLFCFSFVRCHRTVVDRNETEKSKINFQNANVIKNKWNEMKYEKPKTSSEMIKNEWKFAIENCQMKLLSKKCCLDFVKIEAYFMKRTSENSQWCIQKLKCRSL